MRLRNLIYEKEMLKRKISELKNIIKYDTTDSITNELFVQLELLQAKNININTINNQIKIKLGGKDVDISTTVILRDTAKEKINILTSLIIDNKSKLDKVELIKQRDDIYEEYVLLSNEITLNDLNVNIGE